MIQQDNISNASFFLCSLENLDRTLLSYSQRRVQNELFFVTSGHIIREYNLNSIRVNKNEFHVSLAGQVTSISEHSENATGFYCCFENVFLEEIDFKNELEKELAFINSFMYQYPLRLTNEVAIRLEYNFRTMMNLFREYAPDYQLIYAYLAVIVYEIKKLMIENNLNPYPSKAFHIAKRYNDLLIQYIDKERSLEFYARQLNVTPNHLNKSIKSTTGRTAVSLLNEMSILEAKIRLKYTENPVSEIAFQLGFEDQSYFCRFFKKATGLTPLNYRKESGSKK